MLKKLGILILAFAMAFALAACGTPDGTSEGAHGAEAKAGGWELYLSDANALPLPEHVQKAFDKALESHTGSELKPISYIAEQVVAGKNYMILCQPASGAADQTAPFQMAVVYEDLQGNAEITRVKDFDLQKYVEGSGTEISAEKLAGGWEPAEDKGTVVMPQEAKDIFDRIAAGPDGTVLEPMALLGTQVVAGTNYAFLCCSTLQTDETINGIQVVTVYADLKGDAQITNICAVDPADFS